MASPVKMAAVNLGGGELTTLNRTFALTVVEGEGKIDEAGRRTGIINFNDCWGVRFSIRMKIGGHSVGSDGKERNGEAGIETTARPQ